MDSMDDPKLSVKNGKISNTYPIIWRVNFFFFFAEFSLPFMTRNLCEYMQELEELKIGLPFIALVVCRSCFRVFNAQVAIFEIFCSNLVRRQVLAQGRRLLKVIRIGPIPKTCYMSNAVKRSGMGHRRVAHVPLQYIYLFDSL